MARIFIQGGVTLNSYWQMGHSLACRSISMAQEGHSLVSLSGTQLFIDLLTRFWRYRYLRK